MKTITKLVAALAIALLVPLLHAGEASAARYSGTAGRVGAVSLNGPLLTAWEHQVRLADGRYFPAKVFEAGGLTVGRSSGSTGAQDVTAIYVLQRWNGSQWQAWAQSPAYSRRIYGNGSVSFPTWAWNPTNQPQSRLGYRMVYVVGWHPAGSSAVLGSTVIIPDRVSDHRCQTRTLGCNVYWDGIVI